MVRVLEVDGKLAEEHLGGQLSGAVSDVGRRRVEVQLADRSDARGPRAEAEGAEILEHIGPPHEARRGIELIADGQSLELKAVAIPVVVDLTPVARVAAACT